MKNQELNWADVSEKYNSALQLKAQLADTSVMVLEIGRGSGKTTIILAKRLMRIAYGLPRSIILLGGATYVFILDTILPGILTYLAENYTRGIHYEYGKRPPKHFKTPYTPIHRWEHTISFPNGTVVQFISTDRPESSIGKNAQAFIGDEMLRVRESDFVERIQPALRGNREIFGKSCYFQSKTFASSTPNYDNDYDWWLGYADEVNHAKIKAIQTTALRVMQARYKQYFSKSDLIQERFRKFADKYDEFLNEKRFGEVYYLKGTSFSNLGILGIDYIKNQFKGAPSTIEKAKIAILGIRPNKIKDPFFSKFGKHNIFTDSYRYNNIDLYSIDGEYKKTSRDLKHYDVNSPLQIGYDPGNFASIVVAQKKRAGKELRILKNIYVIPPEEHAELAEAFNKFFGEFAANKTLYLYYDRAANQRKDRYRGNPKGETDAFIFKTELEYRGWNVQLMNIGQRTIYHWEHFLLNVRLLDAKHTNTPDIYICTNECEALISSINNTGRRKTEDNQIEMDKSAERKLDYSDQAFWSPQIATSMTYLLWGLYHQHMPDATPETIDYEGL